MQINIGMIMTIRKTNGTITRKSINSFINKSIRDMDINGQTKKQNDRLVREIQNKTKWIK